MKNVLQFYGMKDLNDEKIQYYIDNPLEVKKKIWLVKYVTFSTFGASNFNFPPSVYVPSGIHTFF